MVERDIRIDHTKQEGPNPNKSRKLKIKEVIAAQRDPDPVEKALEIKSRLKQGWAVNAEDFLRAVSDEEG